MEMFGMKIPKKVEERLKLYRNVGSIFYDHVNKDGFFFREGGYTTSANLRKISNTGVELGKLRIFDHAVFAYYIYPDGNKMIVALGKRYLIIDPKTLKVLQKLTKNIPSYPESGMVVYNNLICTVQRDRLRIYDIDTAQRKIVLIKTKQQYFQDAVQNLFMRKVATKTKAWVEYWNVSQAAWSDIEKDQMAKYADVKEITIDRAVEQLGGFPVSYVKAVRLGCVISLNSSDKLEIITKQGEKYSYNFLTKKLI